MFKAGSTILVVLVLFGISTPTFAELATVNITLNSWVYSSHSYGIATSDPYTHGVTLDTHLKKSGALLESLNLSAISNGEVEADVTNMYATQSCVIYRARTYAVFWTEGQPSSPDPQSSWDISDTRSTFDQNCL